jgi:hypothetical protein
VYENIRKDLLPSLKNLIKQISNDTTDDDLWKSSVVKYRSEWNKTSPYLRPRFKRDHKSQKRIQCAITHKDFIKIHSMYKAQI